MRHIVLALLAALVLAGSGGCQTLSPKHAGCGGAGCYEEGCGDCVHRRAMFQQHAGGCQGCGHGHGKGGHGKGGHGLGKRGAHDPFGGRGPDVPYGMNGPPAGTVTYPYYTTRGPRDFLLNNPPSIGP